jgi:hypothetical protein
MAGELALAFAEYTRKRKNADWVQKVCEVAALGMWPFKTGEVLVSWYDRGYLGLDLVFRIDVQAVPDYVFQYKFDERQIADAYFPEQFVFDSMKTPLLNWFRYRPSLPVDDHIVLGED